MKQQNPIWIGFLEAGNRSSPVLRDDSLDTGNPATIYLFNLMKDRILEYRKDIVEPRLRELAAEEVSLTLTLQEAFAQARAGFTPRGSQRAAAARRRRRSTRELLSELPDPDEGLPMLDDDGPGAWPAELLD